MQVKIGLVRTCNVNRFSKSCLKGPLPRTFSDTWQLVWEQRVVVRYITSLNHKHYFRHKVIVMTTRTMERARTKCGQYWPELEGKGKQNPINILFNLTEWLCRDQPTVRRVQCDHGEHRELRGLCGDGPQAHPHWDGGGEVRHRMGCPTSTQLFFSDTCVIFNSPPGLTTAHLTVHSACCSFCR